MPETDTLNPRLNRLPQEDRRRRGRVERDGLVPITCAGCGGALGTVSPGAELWGQGCRVWIGADDGPPMPGMDG
jgi:hypothetical protein